MFLSNLGLDWENFTFFFLMALRSTSLSFPVRTFGKFNYGSHVVKIQNFSLFRFAWQNFDCSISIIHFHFILFLLRFCPLEKLNNLHVWVVLWLFPLLRTFYGLPIHKQIKLHYKFNVFSVIFFNKG